MPLFLISLWRAIEGALPADPRAKKAEARLQCLTSRWHVRGVNTHSHIPSFPRPPVLLFTLIYLATARSTRLKAIRNAFGAIWPLGTYIFKRISDNKTESRHTSVHHTLGATAATLREKMRDTFYIKNKIYIYDFQNGRIIYH